MSASTGVALRRLLPSEQVISWRGDSRVSVRGLCADSRRASPGAVFFAMGGQRTDGNRYVEEAIGRGVVAVVSEEEPGRGTPGVYVQVKDIRVVLAQAARSFFGEPDQKVALMAVTGTNGKTTVSYLYQHLLTNGSERPGMIGTVQYDLGVRRLPAYRTTPEPVELWGLLAQMSDAGCRHGVMETSSHGIVQGRIRGLRFAAGAFLNLTQDHLDFHGDMESYYAAKRMLFTGEAGAEVGCAVIDGDDPYGRRLMEDVRDRCEVVTFGTSEGWDLRAHDLELGPEGTRFHLRADGRVSEIWLPLPGGYNVSNALAALALAKVAGLSPHEAGQKLADFPGVPGRMQRVSPDGFPFTVFVDYAHTPDALSNALGMLRTVATGRLLVVFGCGGNRDRTKRPLMTKAVLDRADRSWATADNPRQEALGQIFADMKAAVWPHAPIVFVEDRRYAISLALDEARAGDIVLIAGKGHETFQELADTVVPFDDTQVARRLLDVKASSFAKP